MSTVRRVMPLAMRALTSPRLRDARRWLAERKRRRRGEPHRILYFHRVDDPYSQLAAQLLGPLLERYDVAIEPRLVGPSPDDTAPERARLDAFALRDAADVAAGYRLEFPGRESPPDSADTELASRVLAGTVASGAFAAAAPRLGHALWNGDRAGLDALATEFPPAPASDTHAMLDAGSALRRRLGHYLAATFYYGGEWYWGVDRLWHLERRLQSLGALRAGQAATAIAPRPDPAQLGDLESTKRVTLEYFASLRSPYTYIALERVLALAGRLPVDLVPRPVLPMVMRGLPVPRAKRLYIVTDTKREADDAGVPFGRICDPVGRPVERGYSLYPWASKHGRAGELLLSFTRAAFGEGIDTGKDSGLRGVVERAGLSWQQAAEHLDRNGWQDELETNRRVLLELGLWGVPSFRVLGADGEPDYCTWGQDRLWRVEQEIRRRVGDS